MRNIAQRNDIRDLILDEVEQLLARQGYHKMTMDNLAQQVGIGKGTIYLHFPSKEELTLSHIDRIAARVLQQLISIAASDGPLPERIKQMLITRVLFRFDSVRNYSQSLNELLSSLRKDLIARREVHFENEARVFAAVLEEGKKAGVFNFKNSNLSANVLVWSTNSLLPYSLSPKELGKRKAIEERVSAIADVLVHGLMRKQSRQLNPKRKQQLVLS